MKKETIFTGSGVAIVTPFTKDGIDFDKLAELIDWQIENGTDAIIICGTTGESATMPDDEHLAAIAYTVERVNGRVPVIAGAGSNDTRHGIELSKESEALGADALLHVTPYYNKATQKGLYEHFKAIAESVDIPIVLYNVPSRTGVSIALDTLGKLADLPNIAAIKEASGSLSAATDIIAKYGDKIDVYSGNDDIILPMLSIGCKGVISVLANIAPKETHQLCQSFFEGDIETSRKMQLKAAELNHALFCEVNPIPVKTALNLMGKEVGPLRLPLCSMEEKNLEILKKALKNYGLLS